MTRKLELSVPAIALVAAAIVILLWVLVGMLASQQPKPGEFGDMFGAVNSLFTGLAFAGLIVTIWLQSRELALQREELRQTRLELAGQREQLELQTKAMLRQSNESHFFQLLDRFRTLASTIRMGAAGGTREGITYWQQLQQWITSNSLPQVQAPGTVLENLWSQIYDKRAHELGPYFAMLSELLSFIAGADSESKARWARITRALLWPHEMAVIFYQGMTSSGRLHLKGYVEEFGLFRFLPINEPAVTPMQRSWYAEIAFANGDL